MSYSDFVVLEEHHRRFQEILERLLRESNAKLVFLVDKIGQQIASAGTLGILDPTSLASLTAGNVAATDGLAKLIGEKEFSVLFHEGEHDNLHISVVARQAIVVVLFDEHSSLGLVRLRVKKTTAELAAVLEEIAAHMNTVSSSSTPFSEITDEDIDALFN